MFNDNLFKKIEKKTNVNKDTIYSLASKLQKGNMKDEKTLTEVIEEIAKLTGKEVTEEKRQKLINAIINDKIPSNVQNNF